jgi:putative SbcD/Mre11-related phosphoesterase
MVDAELRDLAAYLPDADALVLADLHLGRDVESNVQLPLGETENLAERLGALLDRFEPALVVLAGDVLHAFDRVAGDVEDALATLQALVADAGADLVVTPGNHDGLLADATDLNCQDERRLPDGETVVCHGHEEPDADADRYVIGHDHPAIRIEGKKYPCYLLGRGTYRDANVVVLPSFNPLVRGTVVNSMERSDFHSPVIASGSPIGAYRPVVWDETGEEALEFPPLSEFRRLL